MSATPTPSTTANSSAHSTGHGTRLAGADAIVAAAVREISHIATLPEITVKIIELVEDPNSTAQDLHKVIANDPALCSRVLKVVNSSFYGLPGQIGSINRAIVMLGLNAVKNIAISASLAKLFRGGELCPNLAARDLWVHSITTAAACKLLADTLGMGVPDEAFLAGLIHDIGVMVELQSDRKKLVDVVGRLNMKDGVPANEMLTLEREVYGADHQAFGAGLCEKWKFPKAFAAVTGNHHNPLDLPSGGRSLACLVYIADRLAGETQGGLRLDLTTLDIDGAVMEELGLTDQQLEKVKARMPEALKDVESLLG